ncbi:50S ribosomal protein L30 [archaeon]|nr:50S ribosomal protein L30 [archaeon]|tara:strand:+ start:1997 stop:2251 length:255 start_codon:yes stop_codon:yes gene_type:complete
MSLVDLKKVLKEKEVVIGTDKAIKNIKRGKCEKVFLSSNCPEEVKGDIEHYSKLNKTEIVQLKQPNDELGMICKKPFSISVLCY